MERKPKKLPIPWYFSDYDGLYKYLVKTRGIGHTNTLKEAIKHIDKPFYLLTPKMDFSKEICKDIKNATPTSPNFIERGVDLPMIIDNFTYINLCETHDKMIKAFFDECLEAIDEKEKYIEELTERHEHKVAVLKFKITDLKYKMNVQLFKFGEVARENETLKNELKQHQKNNQDFLNNLNIFQRIFKKIK